MHHVLVQKLPSCTQYRRTGQLEDQGVWTQRWRNQDLRTRVTAAEVADGCCVAGDPHPQVCAAHSRFEPSHTCRHMHSSTRAEMERCPPFCSALGERSSYRWRPRAARNRRAQDDGSSWRVGEFRVDRTPFRTVAFLRRVEVLLRPKVAWKETRRDGQSTGEADAAWLWLRLGCASCPDCKPHAKNSTRDSTAPASRTSPHTECVEGARIAARSWIWPAVNAWIFALRLALLLPPCSGRASGRLGKAMPVRSAQPPQRG